MLLRKKWAECTFSKGTSASVNWKPGRVRAGITFLSKARKLPDISTTKMYFIYRCALVDSSIKLLTNIC